MCYDMMNSRPLMLASLQFCRVRCHLSSSLHDALSKRVNVNPRGCQGVVISTFTHLSPFTTPLPPLLRSHCTIVLYCHIYFAFIHVLASPCFIVMKVSFEFRLVDSRADDTVLTNRKYGVATVWYARIQFRTFVCSHTAGSSRRLVPSPA